MSYMTEEVDEWIHTGVAHGQPVGGKPDNVNVGESRKEETSLRGGEEKLKVILAIWQQKLPNNKVVIIGQKWIQICYLGIQALSWKCPR